MFAVYAKEANIDDPLASVVVGERLDPVVKEGWVRVKVNVGPPSSAMRSHMVWPFTRAATSSEYGRAVLSLVEEIGTQTTAEAYALASGAASQ